MIQAYSIDDVRAAEDAARAGLPDGELMQRAAEGLVQVALARLEGRGDRVVVLAGPGDNGGDALYAGARIAEAGANVVAVQTFDQVHDEAMAAALAAGVVRLEWTGGAASGEVADALAEADLVLDGVLGISGRPGLPAHLGGEAGTGLEELIADDAWVVAVDLPSGCDPAGLTPAACVYADETVTFGLVKPVHLLPATELACGVLTVVDIGVDPTGCPVVERLTFDDASSLWPHPTPYSDKYSRGVLGLVAGSEEYTGAAVLSATAAVTAGVGMLRYVGPERPANILRHEVPEAVFGVGRVQAWTIGSGWSVENADPDQASAARDALASDLPVLLDAGGLDLLTDRRDAPTLLTPHYGELQRLAQRLDIEAPDGSEHGVGVAQQVADRLGVTVLIKGAVTAVVSPSGSGRPIRTQAQAPSWSATAGAGDVLGGLAGTLLAGGLEPSDAGALAALVHGVAADVANPGGPVRALDIARHLGVAVRSVLQSATLDHASE